MENDVLWTDNPQFYGFNVSDNLARYGDHEIKLNGEIQNSLWVNPLDGCWYPYQTIPWTWTVPSTTITISDPSKDREIVHLKEKIELQDRMIKLMEENLKLKEQLLALKK